MEANKYTICVENADKARAITNSIRNLIDTYGCATVQDLRLLIEDTPDPIDEEYGWVSIPEIEIFHSNGFIGMDFPSPVPLEPKAEPKETVNHPSHYQSKTGLEAWDVIDAFTSDLTGIEAFDTGNVLKYMCRWKGKNGLEDLYKAKRYLEHLIDHVENSKKETD